MTKDEKDIIAANKALDKLEDEGLLSTSQAATVFLRKYGEQLGVKNPTRFSYDTRRTKIGNKVVADFARMFLNSKTSTPEGVYEAEENRRSGIIQKMSNFNDKGEIDTINIDRYLEIADRIGDIVANYSLGSDIFYEVSQYVYNEDREINQKLINGDEDINKFLIQRDEDFNAFIELFEEEVDNYEKLNYKEMDNEEQRDLFIEMFRTFFTY